MPRKPALADRLEGGYFQKTEVPPPESPDSGVKRTKRTWYISDEALISLAELQARQYRETGVKPELSALVEEGLTLLFEKYGHGQT